MDDDAAEHRYYRALHARRRRRRRLVVAGFWIGAVTADVVGSIVYAISPTKSHWDLLGLLASPILIAACVTGAVHADAYLRNPPGTYGGGFGGGPPS